jgi:hypothetical protein
MKKPSIAKAVLACVSIASALAGCGGDSPTETPPPPPAPIIGIFAGPVQGLSFQTPTQSGVTGASGQFRYVEGETVTFRIGGVTLGSAPGAPRLDLFSLARLAPPRTEIELRREFLTPNDVTDFDRVANRALFLTALDNDADGSNGLDLSGWDEKLANATLSFDYPMFDFALQSRETSVVPFDEFSAFARRFGLNKGIPLFTPLVQLYRALGISVAVQARSSVSRDSDGDGNADSVRTFGYDAEGREISASFASNGDEDVISRTFGSNSRLESTRRQEKEGLGDRIQTSSAQFDTQGRLLGAETEIVRPGVIDHASQRFTLDATGNAIGSEFELDGGEDGTIDFGFRTTSTFDAQNNQLTRVSDEDLDGDGSPESRREEVNTFDARGNVLTSVVTLDDPFDGNPEAIERITFTYDASGNLLSERNEFEEAGSVNVSTFSNTYDAANRVIVVSGADGPSRSLTEFVYDARNNISHEVRKFDRDGDGTVDETTTIESTYDDVGNLVRVLREEDGTPREETVTTFAPGLLLASRVVRSDTNGDGVFDRTDTSVATYSEVSQGLEALVREYAAPLIDFVDFPDLD